MPLSKLTKTSDLVTTTYSYNSLVQLTQQTANGVVFVIEDGSSVTAANVLTNEGGIIGSFRGTSYHNYLTDVQGSITNIIKEDETLSAAYDYTDFGETTELTGNGFDNQIGYTSGIYDESTALYYLNARYYDPETGRFISQDSYRGELDEPGQWHLYAYCANNPINYVDPSGHMKKHWYNSVKWVGRFIDAAVTIYGGVAGVKALKAYIKKNKKNISERVRRTLERKVRKNITKTYITTALDLVYIFTDTTIGKLIAKGLDYADKWLGYKRNNGYILN